MNDLDVAHSTGRGVRNRLTQQRRRAAVQLASAGWTACQIADLFGVAPWIVRRCLSDQGALAPEITDELLSPRDVEIAVGLTRRWISELVKTGSPPLSSVHDNASLPLLAAKKIFSPWSEESTK